MQTTTPDKSEKQAISPESFRDRIGTVDSVGHRKWVYAQKPKGRFYRYRSVVSWFFFALFLTLPLIYINGRPFFLFNIPKAKFILFGQVFWPQDFFIFGLTMVTFVVFIILFTAAFGRLFCGWVCPQTIFMEMVFRKIEYLIEGDAPKQKMLKAAPWTGRKIFIKTTKHLVFFLLSFIIANFFLAYIISAKELWKTITEPFSQHLVGLSAIVVFSAIFYAVYAYFREQACIVICPYGRLQSVLLDRNSMIVAYDYKRGEPRGNFKKHATEEIGDCIDCFQCVRVCPTGIDIRNGTQMECVGCTACIDVCDSVMTKINRSKGLIRYASENGIAESEPLRYTGRMKLYTVLLLVLISILSTLLITRKDLDATVLRAPGMLYQDNRPDSISNLYNIKVANKTVRNVPLTLKLEDMNGAVEIIGGRAITIKSEDEGSGTFFVILPKNSITHKKTPLRIALYEGNKKIDVVRTVFLGPVSN